MCVVAGQSLLLRPEIHLPRQGYTLESQQLNFIRGECYYYRIHSHKGQRSLLVPHVQNLR